MILKRALSILILLLVFTTQANAQCQLKPGFPFQPDVVIREMSVRLQTRDEPMAGTTRDVYLDLGFNAWRLGGSFERGTVRTVPFFTFATDRSLTGIVHIHDLKYIRLEKKGIGLSDLPPVTPAIVLAQTSGAAAKIGGLTDAPDSIGDLILSGVFDPNAALPGIEKQLQLANQAAIVVQNILAELEQRLAEARASLQKSRDALSAVERHMNAAEDSVVAIVNDLFGAQTKLEDAAFKFAIKTVCTPVTRTAGCLAFPTLCLPAAVVCSQQEIVTDAWRELNNFMPSLRSRLAGTTADLVVATSPLQALEAVQTVTEATVDALQAQVDAVKVDVALAARTAEALAKSHAELLPFLKAPVFFPGNTTTVSGQWMPESLVLIVNGQEFVECTVGVTLKRKNSSWIGLWASLSPEEMFASGLRMARPDPFVSLDRYVAMFATFVKIEDISGWQPGPVQEATIEGLLMRDPSVGTDGYVSLDLLLFRVTVNGKRLFAGSPHGRWIRVEYRHIDRDGNDDRRFEGWKHGHFFRVTGVVKRDTDRGTFFEIHPANAAAITRVP